MKSYKEFEEIIKNRSILYIPIISCINRDTGEYNLSADGNVNRFITTFSYCNTYKKLTIILPEKHIKGSEEFLNKFKTNKIDFIYCKNFGIHAGEQRNDDKVVNSIFNEIKYIDFDICIFEGQKLGWKFLNTEYDNIVDKKFIFWNPVSKTKDKTRIFLEGYEEINQNIIKYSNYMIIASPDQYEYYKEYESKLIYLDKLIDRDLHIFNYEVNNDILNKFKDNKNIFYLPFRLSDEGYKFDKVLNYLSNIKEDFIVLYTDPNNSHIIDNLDIDFKDKFIKVSSDRNTYYTILDYLKCTILYFEDLEFINHAAIHEFMNNKCKANIILYNQTKNPYNVNNCKRINILYE